MNLVRTRVYVAGPYSDGDTLPEDNRATNVMVAVAAGDILFDKGYAPFIPHLTHFWHAQHPHHYDEWIAYGKEWMRPCHCALLLPGPSSGTRVEEAYATEQLKIPTFTTINKLQIAVPHCLPDGPPAEVVKAAMAELERERKVEAMSDD